VLCCWLLLLLPQVEEGKLCVRKTARNVDLNRCEGQAQQQSRRSSSSLGSSSSSSALVI
jgi:hypothetical protein